MTEKPTNDIAELCCGLVMPISTIDGCNEQHWSEVKDILTEAIELANFKANLVSYADDVGIIQKRIIQNLYENPIVICDVSGKNPNVMFELGMRLAFDKPTIIIKDDKTSYSFDTSPIEHLEYPRDLRFSKIVEFKEALKSKIKATYEKATTDPNYTTFLKHFGTFTVAKLDTKEISKEDYIIEELKEMKKYIQRSRITDREYIRMIDETPLIDEFPEKLYIRMFNTINQILEEDFSESPTSSKRNSQKIRKMVFERILNDPRFRAYSPDPKQFHHVFMGVYNDVISQID